MKIFRVFVLTSLVLVGYISLTNGAINCDDPNFRSLVIGIRAFYAYHGYYYNFGYDFKAVIAEKFFDGFKVIGKLALFRQLYDRLNLGHPYSSVYNGTDYVGYFDAVIKSITKNSCEWLKTYNSTFTFRDINCDDPRELALMSSYIGTYRDAESMLGVILEEHCSPFVDFPEIEAWLNQTLPAKHEPARQEIRRQFFEYLDANGIDW